MKKLKRLFSCIVAMAMVLSLMPTAMAAENGAVVAVQDGIKATAGSEADFPVLISNNPGIGSFTLLYWVYDSNETDVTEKFTHELNAQWAKEGVFTGLTPGGPVDNRTISYVNLSGGAVAGNGTMFTMSLTPDEGLVEGTYKIKMTRDYYEGEEDTNLFADGDGNPVAVTFPEVEFTLSSTVTKASVTPTVTVTGESSYDYAATPPTPMPLTANATVTQPGGTLSYQWYTGKGENKTVISGATTATYTPVLPTLGASQDYTCVVTNTYNEQTFTGEGVVTVEYRKGVIDRIEVTGADNLQYTGNAPSLTYTVKDANNKDVAASEYKLSFAKDGAAATEIKDAGKYTVTATANDNANYTGSAEARVVVGRASYTVTQNPSTTIYLYDGAPDVAIGSDILSVRDATGTEIADRSMITYASGNPSKVTIVNGKLHPVATGAADVTATIAGDDNHNGTTATIRVTVSEKEDVSSAVTFEAQTGPFTYSDTPAALSTYVNAATITDGTLTNPKAVVYRLDGEVVDSLNVTKVLDAGEHTFTATFEDDTKIGVGTVKITIEKATVTPTVTWPTTTYTYTGEAQTIAATVDDTDKVEIASYTNATQTNAGTYNVTANLQIKADAAKNYKLADSIPTAVHSWEIAKATHDALTDTVTIRFNQTDERQYTAAQILTKDAKFVEVTNLAASKTDSGNLLAKADANAEKTAIDYQLNTGLEDPGDTPKTATITITFDSTNYINTTLTLTVNVTSKTPVESTFLTVPVKSVTYTGVAQAYDGANYTGTKEGTGKYTYTYADANSQPVANPTDAGTYTVTATYTDDAYICTNTGTFTIAPAPLSITAATVSNKEYDKSDVATVTDVTITGTVNSETLTKDTDYEVSAKFDNANVGDGKAVTVTVAMKDTATAKNYTLTPNTFATTANITKKTVTPTVTLTPDTFTFNNTEQKPTVTVTYTDNGTVTMDPKEYIVTYGEDCTNVGTVTVKVEANSSNYTFGEQTATYTITKATATLDAVNKSYKYGTAVEDAVTLPTLTNPGTNPAVAYEVGALTDDNSILDGAPTVADGVVSYKIKDSGANGNTATIPVTIKSQNYNDVTVNVVITLTDKDVPTVSANDITKVYDGQDLSGITGTATFDGAAVPGTWSIVSPVASEVKNASATAYNVTVKFTPDDKDAYAEVEDQITVTISKATPTVTPTFTAITEAGKTLADAPLDCTSEPAGSIAWDDPADTVVVANQSYGWTFTPDDATNYETATGTLIPFVQNPPDETEEPNVPPILPPSGGNGSGSTGGGSGSGSGNQGGSTTNPDQSVTTTTTDRDGNVTTTTTYPNGSKSVVEMKTDGTIISTDTDAQGNTATVTQNPDGSSVKTVENIDGSSSIQNTTSDGQTSAMVNLPSETVDASNASGAPASLPMDAVTATKDSATAPVVMVNTANDEPVKVEIPVTNANNGTVAVLVKADGTEEIIKTTALTGDGVAVKVNSGDTVKIIDNTKTFSDTATHWGSDAVTFVAARELFSGTSETRFSPDDNMTRGMLMTVLARYENVDTNGGSVWYEKGVAWAVAQGLSDGTNPNGQISREQLATIIYRYAQSKGIDTTAGGSLERFPDAGSVSDWAREAMSWAVGNGIISGVGGVTLDPSGNATRAQVATILMRFSEKFPA